MIIGWLNMPALTGRLLCILGLLQSPRLTCSYARSMFFSTEFNKSVRSLRKGEMGVPGEAGPDGQTSDKGEMDVNGEKGSQGLPSGGSVFTRWGTTSCPSSSKFLYSGKENHLKSQDRISAFLPVSQLSSSATGIMCTIS